MRQSQNSGVHQDRGTYFSSTLEQVPKILSDSWCSSSVIPANAGIQVFQSRGTRDWTPAFAGVTSREARGFRTKSWTTAVTLSFSLWESGVGAPEATVSLIVPRS
jgi:hypothetical protein